MESCTNKFFIYEGKVLKNVDFKETMISSGKSIYEVIRVIEGVPLFLEKHLERLTNSVKISDLTLSLSASDIKRNILKLIEINEAFEGNIKIVFNYVNDDSRFIAYFINHSYPTNEQYKNGVTTMLFYGERNNPNAKVINFDFRNAVDREIKEKNVYEAILIDNKGNVTEGSKSNIFMVKGNVVITAPIDAVLPGITRQSIIDVCSDLHIEVKEENVSVKELLAMDGIFISGTSPKVLPVNEIYDQVHFNSNNKIILSIIKSYNEKIQDYIDNHKI